MKKFFNIALLTLVAVTSLSLSSCKNEIDEIFDEDAIARLDKKKAEYVDILTSNGGKWALEYYSNANEPGYVYLMTFERDGSVQISGMNKWIGYVKNGSLKSPAFGSEVSLWEIIADNGPVLTFNSYNQYFHLFADPYDLPSESSSADMGGNDTNESGYGHEGDYEFVLMKYSGDTLYLHGKKYGLNMIMTRVNAVDDEIYMNEVTAMADSFFNAKIPQVYINLPNDVRWIVKEGSTGIIKMFREGADEISTAEKHNIIITHDGLSFMEPLSIDGYTIQNFIRQPDGSLLCRDDMQTTMTADELSRVITAYPQFSWTCEIDSKDMTKNVGGIFATLMPSIANELQAFSKNTTLASIVIAPNAEKNCYNLTFNTKKRNIIYNPTYYMNIEVVDDNHIRCSLTGEVNDYGAEYFAECPSLVQFANALATAIELKANSLLAPVNMTFCPNATDYVIFNLVLAQS